MPKKPRQNGRILTVKLLDKRAYNAIHLLPRGFRQETMRALLTACADLAEKNPQWFKAAVSGHVVVSVRRHGTP